MQVRYGFSGEIQSCRWLKLDATLDETDLRRILANADLGGVDPNTLPTPLVFKILSVEAERLVLASIAAAHGLDDERLQRMTTLNSALVTAFEAVRKISDSGRSDPWA